MEAGLPACVMTLFENVSYAVLDKLMSFSGLAMQAGVGVAKRSTCWPTAPCAASPKARCP